MDTLDELLVALGFEYDDEGLDNFRTGIDNTLKAVKFLAAGVATLTAATSALLVTTNAATDEQGKLAEQTDTTIAQVGALSQAMKIAGDDGNNLASTLTNLAKTTSEAARGTGGGIEAFGLLGIQLEDTNGELKNTFDLLLEISGQFENISNQQQIELADKLGVSSSLRTLQLGRAAIEDLIESAEAIGVATEEDAKIAAEFNDSMSNMLAVFKQISRIISRELSPLTTDLVNTFVEWWKVNREIIELSISEYIDDITFAIKLLTVAVGALMGMRLIAHLLTLISIMRKLSVVTLAFQLIAVALPTLITAAILALILIVEDLWTAFKGGESVAGDLAKWFPEWADEIELLTKIVGGFGEAIALAYNGLSDLIKLLTTSSMDDFKDFINNIPGFAKFLLDGAVNSASSGFDNVFNPPLSSNDLGTTTNNSTSSQASFGDINVTVEGTSDPETTANLVGDKITQSIQELYTPVVA